MWASFKVNPILEITDIYSLFEAHFDHKYTFHGETHNFWECVYVQNGTISVSGNERVYTLSKGDVIFHKPLELHKFSIESTLGADLFIFSFSVKGDLPSQLKYNVFKLNEEKEAFMNAFLTFLRRENDKYPTPEFKEYKFLREDNLSDKYLNIVTGFISIFLLNLSDDTSPCATDSSPNAEIFKKAVNYMNDNISNQLSIEQIARFCNISPTGLKRVFRKYSGLGIHKYYLKIKINAAIELLKDGHTISDTANILGFSNQGYFSFVFKRETDKNPSQYKK